ncbi:DUF2735 domain-containing protein [Methylopila sp. Yamaguchi]|uniref:DUF2735 domain-containing protein n=1 Tax=Methylopila sp. Yamaguchi TaxID=1437817 RepID=UPI000CB43CDE|nr:DUF2735 domain-containing protein [Methylopila sp. Yamaguchi]GBD49765.1 hypothetical protein METY_2978 [Methylopila sp. Yamaguchi]
MTSAHSPQPTAKIYSFPQNRIAAADARRKAQFAAEIRAAVQAPVVQTGAWYHDEAIRDSKGVRPN